MWNCSSRCRLQRSRSGAEYCAERQHRDGDYCGTASRSRHTVLMLLQPHSDDRISQQERTLALRISNYRSDDDRPVVLPPALSLRVLDDELPVVQHLLAVGLASACALLNEGSVRCWYGQRAFSGSRMGLDTTAIQTARDVQISLNFVCWLRSDATVACAGKRNSRELAVPEDLSAVSSLVVGRNHSCSLSNDGRVRCWGDNRYGQSAPPEDIEPAIQIVLGFRHSCALIETGRVRCWGHGPAGSAGDSIPAAGRGGGDCRWRGQQLRVAGGGQPELLGRRIGRRRSGGAAAG